MCKIWIPSGSTMLNLALTGRYDRAFEAGRIYNIIGDKAVGKTLLAMETLTCAYYTLKDLELKLVYDDAETAFNHEHAKALGCPMNKIELISSDSVEDFFYNICETMSSLKNEQALIYVLDSLDALTTEEEKKIDITDGTYGTQKAKKMSEIFRRILQMVEKTNTILIIISQIRENIGTMFGRKWKRSGGKALDFYASSIIILSELGKIKKNVGGFERVIGIDVGVQIEKNKQWKPYRSCAFPIVFNYGIDDTTSCVNFLIEVKRINESKGWIEIEGQDKKMRKEAYVKWLEENNKVEEIRKMCQEEWDKIENTVDFDRLPKWTTKHIPLTPSSKGGQNGTP